MKCKCGEMANWQPGDSFGGGADGIPVKEPLCSPCARAAGFSLVGGLRKMTPERREADPPDRIVSWTEVDALSAATGVGGASSEMPCPVGHPFTSRRPAC